MEELKKSVERLEQKIDNNAVSIIQNMNKLHSHDDKINANAEKIQQNSWAIDILRDYKSSSKRLFIMWIITFLALIGVCCYLVYLMNDIGAIQTTNEYTQEVNDINDIGGNIINGGN